ncbi:MAG: glycosyltransferase, partial [Elusimicrobiaceae bacterium]|nr:glycosyltransferase [Elusimicrobiaceae bacterium]
MTLKTLLWQEGGPWDIWVLDNSTNNETKKIVEKDFPQIHYVDTRADRKLMANLRKLRELAITPYSLTLHDDDLLAPSYLKNSLKILNAYPNINGIFAKLKLFHGGRFPSTIKYHRGTKHWLINNKADFALSFWDKPSASWSGSVLKSDLYKKIPAEDLYKTFGKIHDWPMLIEIAGEGNNCIFTDSY